MQKICRFTHNNKLALLTHRLSFRWSFQGGLPHRHGSDYVIPHCSDKHVQSVETNADQQQQGLTHWSDPTQQMCLLTLVGVCRCSVNSALILISLISWSAEATFCLLNQCNWDDSNSITFLYIYIYRLSLVWWTATIFPLIYKIVNTFQNALRSSRNLKL